MKVYDIPQKNINYNINFKAKKADMEYTNLTSKNNLLMGSLEQIASSSKAQVCKDNWFMDFYASDVGEITLTQNMKDSADIIFKLCNPQKDTKLLDLCCGKGYLSNELSQRGLNVVGVDLSEKYINFANKNYNSKNCKFVRDNAETFRLKTPADIIVNWHTSMAYSENDAKNKLMLKSMAENLKEGGEFIISIMNPDFIKNNFQRFIVKHIPYKKSSIITIRESFIEGDMLKSNWMFVYPNGERKTSYGQTKMYTAADYTKMLKEYGLKVTKIFGDGLKPFNENMPTMILYGKKMITKV